MKVEFKRSLNNTNVGSLVFNSSGASMELPSGIDTKTSTHSYCLSPTFFQPCFMCMCHCAKLFCQRAQLWKVCKSLHLALHLLITSVRLLKEARGQWVQCWIFWQKGNQCCWFKGHVFGLDARSTSNEIGIIMKNWWVGHVFL